MLQSISRVRCARSLLALWGVLVLHSGLVVAVVAEEPPQIVQIEEHWELQVGWPDQQRSAPQVTMVMSPMSWLDGPFFIVTLNHWTVPDFQAGGVQVQRWFGEDCLESKESHCQHPLESVGESITWVQRMTLSEGNLHFELDDGNSQTWGPFGGGSEMRVSVPTSLTSLNAYQPAVSLTESGVGFGGNRVTGLFLQRLRWETADGAEHELLAPIGINTSLTP